MSNAPLHTLNLRRCILFFLFVKVLAVVVVVVAVVVLMFIIPVHRIRFVPHAFHFLWNSFPLMGWWHLSHVRCCSCFVFEYHLAHGSSWCHWCSNMNSPILFYFSIVLSLSHCVSLALLPPWTLFTTSLMGRNNWITELFYFNYRQLKLLLTENSLYFNLMRYQFGERAHKLMEYANW